MDVVVLGLLFYNGVDLGFFWFWGFQLLFIKRQIQTKFVGVLGLGIHILEIMVYLPLLRVKSARTFQFGIGFSFGIDLKIQKTYLILIQP